MTEEQSTLSTLVEWVRAGEMTWSQAVMEFRDTFKCNLLYCADLGVTQALQAVDIRYQTELAATRLKGQLQ